MLCALVSAYPDTPLAKKVKAEYARITEAPLPTDAVPEALLFEVERAFGEAPTEAAAGELLHAFEEAFIREAYQKEVRNLRLAESAREEKKVHEIEATIAKLSARLAKLST